MELSVDEKIQLAIEPLISRIVNLEASHQKLKTELAALLASHQSKLPPKPTTKAGQEPTERPQTVKGGRKKQDDKSSLKKQSKDQHEQAKADNLKTANGKTLTASHKQIPTVPPKELTTLIETKNQKDPKHKPTGAVGQGAGTKDAYANKSAVHQKKPNTLKNHQNQHEKKEEGTQKTDEKKGHASQQKLDNKDNKSAKTPLPVTNKNPAHIKPKPTDKVVPEKKPAGSSNTTKKAGKAVIGGASKQAKTEEAKTQQIKTEDVKVEQTKTVENTEKDEPLLLASEDNKEQIKTEELKPAQEVSQPKKQEQVQPNLEAEHAEPKIQVEGSPQQS